LAYYFRGLLGPEKHEPIRKLHGVLNILWDWHRAMESVTGRPEVDELVERYAQGKPFDECVSQILGAETFEGAGELHYMSAGSANIELATPTLYSDALSLFPWPQFFTDSVGGALINAWRDWAKRNYDLVLLDSRTGLADVAGVCTMLFPDEVYLCFVLNRQNIEGTARVAASIRKVRKDEVGLRAAPMRISRLDTPEENDARANAVKYLTRVGGFSEADVLRDFAQLSIQASQSVPFYETIAPFAVADSDLDPLTLNYCQMTSALLGERVSPPRITDAFRQQVRRRQAPRSATVDYVANLQTAEPVRAVQELTNLVDSAQVALHDEGDVPSVQYAHALADTTFALDDSDVESEFNFLVDSLLQLFRSLYDRDHATWRRLLISAMERVVVNSKTEFDGAAGELSLLDELDHLLAELDDVETLLKRATYRRRAAQLTTLVFGDNDRAMQVAEEAVTLVEEFDGAKADKTDEERAAVTLARMDLHLFVGDSLASSRQTHAAFEHYLAALSLASAASANLRGVDTWRISANIHSRIAARFDETLISPAVAARHAILAVEANPTMVGNGARFVQFCQAVLDPEVPADVAKDLLERIFGGHSERTFLVRSSVLPGMNTIRVQTVSQVFSSLSAVLIKASTAGLSHTLMREIALTAGRMLGGFRSRFIMGGRYGMELMDAVDLLRRELTLRGVATEELSDQLSVLMRRIQGSDAHLAGSDE
jgi:hypothetical protein